MTERYIKKSNKGVAGIVEWFRPGEYEQVERAIADIKALGINHLRTGISWADCYTNEGEKWYEWLIPTLAKEVELLPCVLYTPPSIGEEAKTSSPPRNLKDYADFIDYLINTYGQHFEWIELWNEPNNITEYDYTLDRNWNKFCHMVGGAAYWAKYKKKKTLLGGMSPFDPNWLQLMFDRGVMEYIDAVGIHGFPESFDQQWDGWDKNINKVRQLLEHNNSKAEIWISEAGYSTWKHDEQKQLKYFKEAVDSEADRIYWYGLTDLDPALPTNTGHRFDEREYHFGLKKADGTPKLLYRILKDAGTDKLDKYDYIRSTEPVAPEEPYSLVIGGAGFIGTNVTKRLAKEGKKVMILDNISRPGVEKNLKWLLDNFSESIQVKIGDVRDFNTVKEAVAGATEVFHFAAQVAVTTSLDLPFHDFEVNAKGTLNVLEAIRQSKRKPSLVFTSTNKVYGGLEDMTFLSNGSRYNPADENVRSFGISEARPLDFHSPYGCSKGSADQYVIDYARTFGIQAAVFRMSCIYGPHQFGTEDQGWVAHFIIRAIEGKPISIYGNGKQVRDILFIDDLVDAFMLAQANMDKVSGHAFNIGGGPDNTISLLELLNKIEKLSSHKIPLKFGEWRPGDQVYYVSDIRKFNDSTSWYPKNNVGEGITKLYNWLCQTRGIIPPTLKTEIKPKLKEVTA